MAVRVHAADVARGGPRFDLRFTAGRGVLRLAQSLDAGPARLEILELSLGAVRFPLDVTAGPVRFRTRRTVLRRARLRIDPRDLVRAAEARGVSLVIAGPAPGGAFACAVRDEIGLVAFDATVIADGADLLVGVDRVRVVHDGPATPWARIDRAAGRLGLSFDASRGAWRCVRPVRALLAEALVTRGWRLPDERASELHPPRHRDGALWLVLGPAEAVEEGDAPPELLEEARVTAPVVAMLVEGDLMGAGDRLDAALRRLSDRPAAEASVRDALERLRAATGCERGEDVVVESSASSDVRAVRLRVALRGDDAEAVEAAALALAEVEPVGELAAEALVAASEAWRSKDVGRAHALVRQALGRRPGDVALLLGCLDGAEASGDAAAVEDIARRALSSPVSGAMRARIAAAAARALERLGQARDTEPLWREALYAAPDDPEALAGLGALHARRGERDAAVARLDRAASVFLARDDRAQAARAWLRSAELLAGAGRLAAAEQRLEEAVAEDDADPALWCALARVRVRLGALEAAATAYAALLGLGARGPATLSPALVEAACFHLDERDDATAARPFVELLARRSPGDPRIEPLRRRLDEPAPATEVGSDEVRDAIESARRSGDPTAIGALAEKLVADDRLPEDPDLLDVLERHVLEPATRAALARAAARALRDAGRPGAAALALARAGAVVRDAATLRAAIDLAEGAEAWAEAYEAVSIALEVVGEGPARAGLVARRERIEGRVG